MDVTVYQTKKSDVRLHGAYCTSFIFLTKEEMDAFFETADKEFPMYFNAESEAELKESLSLLRARCVKSFSYTGTYNAVLYENESKLLTKLILWLHTPEH